MSNNYKILVFYARVVSLKNWLFHFVLFHYTWNYVLRWVLKGCWWAKNMWSWVKGKNVKNVTSVRNCEWEEEDMLFKRFLLMSHHILQKILCMSLPQQSMCFAVRCMSVIKYVNSLACCSVLIIYNL